MKKNNFPAGSAFRWRACFESLTVISLLGLFFQSEGSQGTTLVLVRNADFERPAIEGGKILLGTIGEDWKVIRPSAPGSAVGFVPNEESLRNGWPVTPHGRQFIYLCGRKSRLEGAVPNRIFQQVLGGPEQDRVIVGKKYTLTVALANLTNPGDFYFGLYNDAAMTRVLAEKKIGGTLSFNEWRDFSVEWIAEESPREREVYVGFWSNDFRTDSGGRIGIDMVRLEVSEPGDVASGQAAVSPREVVAAGRIGELESNEISLFGGEPVFSMREIFPGRGGRSIAVALDGTLVAFHNARIGIRKSSDGGVSWSNAERIGRDAQGNAVVDEVTGDILLIDSSAGHLWRSSDYAESWRREIVHIEPNRFGHGKPDGIPQHSVAAESGITLKFGSRPGRLLLSTRILAPSNQGRPEFWWPYHYNCSMYSDDGGINWNTSDPFPVLGTGEGALAELSDGRIYYSSRSHTTTVPGRWAAWSYDEGHSWRNPRLHSDIPDGLIGNDYGCHGGLVRLPYLHKDILLYSNVDAEDEGGSSHRGGDRRNISVWVSFDGGQSWPVKRLIYDGPAGYSCMAAGRPGTHTEGQIYMLFEGGPGGQDSAIQFVRFNLDWLLQGYDPDAVWTKGQDIGNTETGRMK